MNIKKVLGVSLAGMMFLGGTAFAAEVDCPICPLEKDAQAAIQSDAKEVKKVENAYGFVKGTIKQIYDRDNDIRLSLKGEDNEEIQLTISKDTYIIDGTKIAKDEAVIAFYESNKPMPAIFPPIYNVAVLSEDFDDKIVKVDVFDKNNISSDWNLQLNIDKTTDIKDRSGKEYTGTITNKPAVVIYDRATKSIPAQTTPKTIVILDNKEIDIDIDEETEKPVVRPDFPEVSEMDIVVEGEKLANPTAYLNANGQVMVPVREIAEKLDFKVFWDAKTETVVIGNIASFKPGQDYYTYAKKAPIYLGVAPENLDGRTYVPLRFFKQVLQMNNAYVLENQIVINNDQALTK